MVEEYSLPPFDEMTGFKYRVLADALAEKQVDVKVKGYAERQPRSLLDLLYWTLEGAYRRGFEAGFKAAQEKVKKRG